MSTELTTSNIYFICLAKTGRSSLAHLQYHGDERAWYEKKKNVDGAHVDGALVDGAQVDGAQVDGACWILSICGVTATKMLHMLA